MKPIRQTVFELSSGQMDICSNAFFGTIHPAQAEILEFFFDLLLLQVLRLFDLSRFFDGRIW